LLSNAKFYIHFVLSSSIFVREVKMNIKSGILILALFLAAFALAGCDESPIEPTIICNSPYIIVGKICCLDSNNNKICDTDEAKTPVDNTPITPSEPEIKDEFKLVKGDIVNVGGKTVTLVDFSIFQTKLETIVDVDGQGWVIHETQKPEIVNNLRITAISVDRLQTYIMLKIVPEKFDVDEYLLRVGERQVILGQEFELVKIQDKDGGALLTVVDGDPEGVFIMPGMTKEYQGLEITNIEPFYRDIRAEGYGIFRMVPA
jgi:hypothetical protein